MIKLLTQNNCGQCVALMNYLKMGLQGQYDHAIEIVKKEDNPTLFIELAKAHRIMATPALISEDGEVLHHCVPSQVKPFLEKHVAMKKS